MKFRWNNLRSSDNAWFPVVWKYTGDSPTTTFIKIVDWCNAHPSTGSYSRHHISYNSQTWYFEYESDALLFMIRFT